MNSLTDDVVVAWQSFSSAAGDAKYGQKFRATDPIVISNSTMFVPLGTPEAEMPSEFDRMLDEMAAREAQAERDRQQAFEDAARRNPIRFEPPRMLELTQDVLATVDGEPALVRKGSIVTRDHWLIPAHPNVWKPVK